jgi:hypothetical protein
MIFMNIFGLVLGFVIITNLIFNSLQIIIVIHLIFLNSSELNISFKINFFINFINIYWLGL